MQDTIYCMKNLNYFLLLLLTVVLVNCKSYHQPIALEDSVSTIEDKKKIKVTLLNGDEFIYDAIIYKDNYYGVVIKNNETITTLINKNNVLKVEEYHKTKGSFMNVFGVLIGLGSLALAVIMLS